MVTRMQQRRDTTANWAANDPILRVGEMGYDTDVDRFKIGDGVTGWLSLPFLLDAELASAQASEEAAAASATLAEVAANTAAADAAAAAAAAVQEQVDNAEGYADNAAASAAAAAAVGTTNDTIMAAVAANPASAFAQQQLASIDDIVDPQFAATAKVGAPNVFTQPQQVNGWLGVGVAPSARQPFNTFVSLTPGMTGTKDKVGNALVTFLEGNFSSGETGSNPLFAWGLNVFTCTGFDANDGAGLNIYNLVETALAAASGTVPVAVGLMSEVAHFGPAAGMHAEQMISHLVGAPKKKDGATGGTSGTAYGLKIENVTAAAAGATTAFALFVEGGISRFQGRVDIQGDIQSQTNSIALYHVDAPGSDGGGRLVVQNKAAGGTIAARLGKPSASFQILKSTDGSIVHAFNETQLGFWKAPVNKKTGWVLPTGTSKRSTFDTATITLAELAGVVKAIVEDLHGTAGYGLLNT
jgi:hypothetical protein